jgi:hypothetical protein
VAQNKFLRVGFMFQLFGSQIPISNQRNEMPSLFFILHAVQVPRQSVFLSISTIRSERARSTPTVYRGLPFQAFDIAQTPRDTLLRPNASMVFPFRHLTWHKQHMMFAFAHLLWCKRLSAHAGRPAPSNRRRRCSTARLDKSSQQAWYPSF